MDDPAAAASAVPDWETVVRRHPAEPALRRLFPDPSGDPPLPSAWAPTGLTRTHYLPLLAGNVAFFREHQDTAGAIIDPYERAERQYSTPAFALAAATLVAHGKRPDLLEPATRAFTFAAAALANKTTANNHADFYIPMLIHAYRLLKKYAPKEMVDGWTRDLRSLVPEDVYRSPVGKGNWNLVNVSGECLRRKDGLVPEDRLDAHQAYLDRCLKEQESAYTRFGMYEDPNSPLAYDAFPRLWLDDVLADDAYHGPQLPRLREFLLLGGLSTLLLLSPSGEWATGGRSAHHQWNEAEVAVICEINARRWQAAGRSDVAGAFKRAAHLALTSMRRWQRPSGEMWIVKNRADPALRHGYENYSFHSQYNLLAVAMLAIAHHRADDTIEERPTPAEVGGYVFDVRDIFHMVCACAGGMYALIDTGSDPAYQATGLIRVHKGGVPFSAYSDNAAPARHYGPSADPLRAALAPGLQWRETPDGPLLSLADFHHARYAEKHGRNIVRDVELEIREEIPRRVAFDIRYYVEGATTRTVTERYTVNAQAVEVMTDLDPPAPADLSLRFPVLVSDGATDTDVQVGGRAVTVRHGGTWLTWEAVVETDDELESLVFTAPERIPVRNGFMRAAVGNRPPKSHSAVWWVRLGRDEQEGEMGRIEI